MSGRPRALHETRYTHTSQTRQDAAAMQHRAAQEACEGSASWLGPPTTRADGRRRAGSGLDRGTRCRGWDGCEPGGDSSYGERQRLSGASRSGTEAAPRWRSGRDGDG